MLITPNMGLVKWNEETDSYDHSQLAGNFQKVDEHDHTINKGIQVPTGGLVDEAITTAKLKDASVTDAKLAGGITLDKLGAGIVASLGDIKLWWRPSSSVEVPGTGWVIAEGQTLNSSQHEFAGGGTIVLPNLIEKFIQGAQLSNVGNSGGASTISLSHQHVVNAHTHSVNPHNHLINLESGFGAETNLKISQDLSGSSWVHSDNAANIQHRHSINGAVGETGLTTNSAESTTDSRLGSQSIIPPYVGLLPLIKVKNS